LDQTLYPLPLSDIEPSILCQPKAVKRLKGIQPFLLFIENQFLELRSMLDIYGDLDLEMVENDENTFNLISDFSTKSVMR